MSAMVKLAIDMQQCKYVMWGGEPENWGDGHLGRSLHALLTLYLSPLFQVFITWFVKRLTALLPIMK